MSSIAAPASREPSGWRLRFTEMLPAIKTQASEALQHLAPEDRPEAIYEAVGRAYCAMATLARHGKASMASAANLARYGVDHLSRLRKQD